MPNGVFFPSTSSTGFTLRKVGHRNFTKNSLHDLGGGTNLRELAVGTTDFPPGSISLQTRFAKGRNWIPQASNESQSQGLTLFFVCFFAGPVSFALLQLPAARSHGNRSIRNAHVLQPPSAARSCSPCAWCVAARYWAVRFFVWTKRWTGYQAVTQLSQWTSNSWLMFSLWVLAWFQSGDRWDPESDCSIRHDSSSERFGNLEEFMTWIAIIGHKFLEKLFGFGNLCLGILINGAYGCGFKSLVLASLHIQTSRP